MDVAGQMVENHDNRAALLQKMTAVTKEAAETVAAAAEAASQTGGEESGEKKRKLQAGIPGLTVDEAEMVAGGSTLVSGLWPSGDLAASGRYIGRAVAAQVGNRSEGGGNLQGCAATRGLEGEDGRRGMEVLRQEPWMPRPMLSIHVRQGDKARRMRLMRFDAYMLAAYRAREYEPFLENVWLSTEMQVGEGL